MNIQEKTAKLVQLHESAVAIINKADATKDELTQADGFLTEALGIQKEIDEAKAREANAAAVSAWMSQSQGPRSVQQQVAAPAQKWGNMGEFLQSVARAEVSHFQQKDARLVWESEIKAASGLNEAVGSEGGFVLVPEYATGIARRAYETGALASRATRRQIGGGANSITINMDAETNRATGSRHGGVQLYWQNEADLATASKPALRQVSLKLNKLVGLAYITDEMLADGQYLMDFVTEVFGEEFGFMLDDTIMNGSGAGQPLGILSAGCLVSKAKETGQADTTIVTENIIGMWSRMYARSRPNATWFINQDIEPQLYTMTINVGTGGIPVYMPAGGVSGGMYGTLFGRPVVPVEQCASLGTLGDIVLADMREYQLIDKGAMQASSSIHVRFLYDETAFKFTYRVDGQPLWVSALTPYKGTSNTVSPFVALAARP